MRGKVVCSEGTLALGSIGNCKIVVPAAIIKSINMFTDIKDELHNQEPDMAEATATANTLADISTLITQQSKNYNDGSRLGLSESNEKVRPRRGRVAEHPCWELVQRVDEHNCMICKICSKVVKCLNTRNAMQHFSSCHPQIAVELDQSWQMKLQLKADFNRISSETALFHRNMWKRRGRAAEHPSWRYFCRINRKSSNCKLCGVHVAYACSGNLMKHLKSRHLAEFAITQREWEEILKVSSNVSGSEEQSPSNFLSYDYEDEQDEGLGGEGIEEEEDGKLLKLFADNNELFEQNNGNENDGSASNGILYFPEADSKLDDFDGQTTAEQHDAILESSIVDDTKITDVSETANRILQSIGFSSHPPKSPSPGLQQQGSWLSQTSLGTKMMHLKDVSAFRTIAGISEIYLMDLDPNNFTAQQQSVDSATFMIKRDPEKTFALVEATATASALADISAIISQQFTAQGDNSDDGISAVGRDLDHPCWDYMHKSDDLDSMVCRICTQRIKPVDIQKAIEHFMNCHPQIATEFEQSWQMKLQLKSSVNRPADEPLSSKEGSERRGGHGTEHPCWRYFTRNRKSADCRMCGTHVAYACSGNLMRHLRSRHISESVITQKEWEEIQKRKKQLCELRMMATANACGSEEQPSSNAVSYAYVDEEQDGSVTGAGEEYDGIVENDEQRYRKESSVSSSIASDIKMNGSSDAANRNMQAFTSAHNSTFEGISPKHQQNPGCPTGSGRSRTFSIGRNAAFQKRINSFVSGLAEELSSFPMQKSLVCMRRIRKFMDEQLLELDEVAQILDDDAGIS
ncbi:hypothetical protein DINM_020094 [Dirofilaria immitis]|nr:hypothetical protein [Dirofilaria immitis]